MKIVTWNLMHAMSRRHTTPELLEWLGARTAFDIAILTEARWPEEGFGPGWSAIGTPDGLDEQRQWGTVIAGRGVRLEQITSVSGLLRRRALKHHWPAAVQVCEVHTEHGRWGVVIGVYGVTDDLAGKKVKHGRISLPHIINELTPVMRRNDRVVLAGDFNLHPQDMPRRIAELGFVDVVEATASTRPALPGCLGCSMGDACGHVWTHRNRGGRNPSAQNIDFIFAKRALMPDLIEVRGGSGDFPDAWDVSDHAPVVATFR